MRNKYYNDLTINSIHGNVTVTSGNNPFYIESSLQSDNRFSVFRSASIRIEVVNFNTTNPNPNDYFLINEFSSGQTSLSFIETEDNIQYLCFDITSFFLQYPNVTNFRLSLHNSSANSLIVVSGTIRLTTNFFLPFDYLQHQQLITKYVGSTVNYQQDVVSFYGYLSKTLFNEPFSCSLIYDFYDPSSQEFSLFPKGWKINLLEKISDISFDEMTLIDERYNRRVFSNTNPFIYTDTTGSGLLIEKITESGSTFYKLCSPINSAYKLFDSTGQLIKIVAENGDETTLTYNTSQITIMNPFNQTISIICLNNTITISSTLSPQVYTLNISNNLLSSISFYSNNDSGVILSDLITYDYYGLCSYKTFEDHELGLYYTNNQVDVSILFDQRYLAYDIYKRFYNYIEHTDNNKQIITDYFFDNKLSIFLRKEVQENVEFSSISFLDDYKSIISPMYKIGEITKMYFKSSANGSLGPYIGMENNSVTSFVSVFMQPQIQQDFDSNYDYLFIAQVHQEKEYSSIIDKKRSIYCGWGGHFNCDLSGATGGQVFASGFDDEFVICCLNKEDLVNMSMKATFSIASNIGIFYISNAFLIKIEKQYNPLYYQETASEMPIKSMKYNSCLISQNDVQINKIIFQKYGYQKYLFVNNLTKSFIFEANSLNKLIVINESITKEFETTNFLFYKYYSNGVKERDEILSDTISTYKVVSTLYKNNTYSKYAILDYHGNVLTQTDYRGVVTNNSYNNSLLSSTSLESLDGQIIENSFSYDQTNRLTEELVPVANIITCKGTQYLNNTKLINRSIDGSLHSTYYNYSSYFQKLSSVSKVINNYNDSVSLLLNDKGRLIGISNNDIGLEFSYGVFDELSEISIPNSNIIPLSIHKTINSDYSERINSSYWSIYQTYLLKDKYDRPKRKYDNQGLDISFTYSPSDSSGLLSSISDLSGFENETTVFTYNEEKEITSIAHIGFIAMTENYTYDSFKRIQTKSEVISGAIGFAFSDTKLQYTFSYNDLDDSVTSVNATLQMNISSTPVTLCSINHYQAKDSLSRLTRLSLTSPGLIIGFSNVEYFSFNSNKTSYQIKKITYYFGGYSSFGYDLNRNISSITGTKTSNHLYYYDEHNQLKKEQNTTSGETIEYSYDRNGNLLSAITKNANNQIIHTDSFGYANSFPNQLTTFNNVSITYDICFNPNVFDGATLTYYRGNKLSEYSKGTLNVQYQYNGLGLRTYKKVNNIVHRYAYDLNNRIVREKRTNQISPYETKTLVYFYGLNGVVAFRWVNHLYLFEKDIFNNVIAIIDGEAPTPTVVAKYEYDAFGNTIVLNPDGTINNSPTFIGNINPFRYRSYYYDSETKFYYCQTRYYVPLIRRWLTMDNFKHIDYKNIYGLNIFIYCKNNPVMFVDTSGTNPQNTVWSLVISALVAFPFIIIAFATDNPLLPYLISAAICSTTGFVFGGLSFKNGQLTWDWFEAFKGFWWGLFIGIVSVGTAAFSSYIVGIMDLSSLACIASGILNNGSISMSLAEIKASIENEKWTQKKALLTFMFGGIEGQFAVTVSDSILFEFIFSLLEEIIEDTEVLEIT